MPDPMAKELWHRPIQEQNMGFDVGDGTGPSQAIANWG